MGTGVDGAKQSQWYNTGIPISEKAATGVLYSKGDFGVLEEIIKYSAEILIYSEIVVNSRVRVDGQKKE